MYFRSSPRSLRDESGATAVLVTILVFVLFGAAAVAVDLGSGWQTKRELVADTDASSLAAALELEPAGAAACTTAAADSAGSGSSDAYVEAEGTLFANRDTTDSNDASYQMVDFEVNCDTGSLGGQVTVAAQREATTVFAGALGLGAVTPANSSTAQWGNVAAVVDGLRPFSACYIPGPPPQGDPHVIEWIPAVAWGLANGTDPQDFPAYAALKGTGNVYPATPGDDYPAAGAPDTYNSANYGSYGVVHRLYFDNGEANVCGSSTGNWGQLCFVGNCGDSDIRVWLEGGYPGGVDLGGPGEGDEDCDPSAGGDQDCTPKTGNFPNGGTPELNIVNGLIADEEEFPILLYDARSGPGGNALHDPSGFLGLIIRGYGPINRGGNIPNGAATYLDVQFTTLTTEGRIDNSGSGGSTGVRGVALCGVDNLLVCS